MSSRIPPTRIQALARFAATTKASAVQRLPDERRVATLVAFILNLEAIALDDALDLLDILFTEIFSDAKNAGEKARLRRIKDLDAAAIQLSQVCRLILDQNVPDAALREAVFAAIAPENLEAAVGQVERLVRPPEDIYYQELCDRFRRVRSFLPSLLRTLRFGATPAGQPVLDALKYLRKVEENGRAQAGNPPRQVTMGCGVDIFRKPTVNSIGKHTFSAVWISFARRFAGVIFLFNQVFDMQMHESGC